MESVTTTRSERTELRKRRIIRAALECFIDNGYSSATMALIREMAGASTGSIYHHFTNKDQLAGAVYLEGIRDYQQGYVEALQREDTAKGGIYAVIEYHLDWVEKNKQWARYLNQMRHAEFMAQKEETFRALNEAFIEDVRSWVLGHLEAGELKPLPQGLFGALLMGPLQEFTRMWLEGQLETSPREASPHLAEAAWQNLKAREDES